MGRRHGGGVTSAIEVGWPRGLVVAIGLLAVLLACTQSSIGDAPGMSARERAELEQAGEARQAETAIARASIASKLEAALGDEFGGLWFDPETAQLHVGVTSPASRRNAGAVAAQEGLTENVTETSVRSTWTELQAAQRRWSGILADLFERGEVTTSIAPDHNAVEVELGSAVPLFRRLALKRKAATGSVDVSVGVASSPHLYAMPEARCKKFVEGSDESFCDPKIVAGVTITDGKKICTAGPTAILKDRSDPKDATKTYLLTAGHCIDKRNGGAGLGAKWYSFNKGGAKHEIGQAISYSNEGTDVGAIEVTNNYWAAANEFIPVDPTIAAWKPSGESEPFPVVQQEEPVVGTKSCISGQSSAVDCDPIIEVEVEEKFENQDGSESLIEKLTVVSSVPTKIGDSGGPWFKDAPYTGNPSVGHAEGTHVGSNEEEVKSFFQPLKVSFEKLKEQNLDLELLTETNKKRHPPVKADKYPVTIHGSTSGTEKFTTEAGTVECKESSYHAVLSEASSTLTVTPDYKSCTASWEGKATVSMEGCTYVYHVREKTSTDNYRAQMDISCPEGKAIKITVGNCIVELKEQTGLETVDLIDDTSASPKRDITVRPTVTGIAYTVAQDGCFCPFKGTGSKTGGEYTNTANITLTGQSPTEAAEKIDIEVADK